MKLSAILLAGGRSRRMGADKATVLIEGKRASHSGNGSFGF